MACLKPPLPPPASHLRVSDWFGEPIAFGDQVRFVCDKGFHFEEDPGMTDVRYTCQDGSEPGLESMRGFFDVPQNEEEWPNCVLGKEYNIKLHHSRNVLIELFCSSAVSGATGDP